MNAATSVLQVRSSAGLYGADRMVLALNGALAGSGASSRLLSINNYRLREQSLHEAARVRGQDAALLPCRGRIDSGTIAALAAHIGRGANVVHTHDYKSAFYAWLATRRQPARLIATLHGWVEGSSPLKLYTRLELALLRRFDALAVVSDDQVERLVRAGVARSRIHQVDNGIECPFADTDAAAALRDALGLTPATFVFAAVARLSSEKNLGMLVDAFAAAMRDAPDAVLLIAGDGPERSALEARVEALNLRPRVQLLGQRDDMGTLYALMDCLVLPSLTEGMPLVVLEAMACERPIIASAVGDVPRLLAQSDHGCVVPPGQLPALEAALRQVQARGRQRDRRARCYVIERHGAQAMAERYLTLYRQLQEDAHGRRAS